MTLITIGLLAIFAYAFAGVFAFPAFLGGIVYHFFTFLLDFVKYNLYPVGSLPYIVIGGGLVFIVIWFVVKLFTKNH